MPSLRLFTLALLVLLASLGRAQAQGAPPAATARATQPQPGALAPAQAHDALAVLQDPARRAQLIATLEAIAKAAPAGQPAASTASATGGQAAPEPKADAAAEAKPGSADAAKTEAIAPNGLGTQLVSRVGAALADASEQIGTSIQTVNDLPLLWRWMASEVTNPDERAVILDAGWKLLVVVAAALIAEWLVRRIFAPLRATLSAWAPRDPHEPRTDHGLSATEAGETEPHWRRFNRALASLRRLPYLFGRLLIDLLPVAAFIGAAEVLLATRLGEPPNTTAVILQVVQAYAWVRIILAVAVFLVSPAAPPLRLLGVSDWGAAFLTRWTRRIIVLAVTGIALSNIGLIFGMYRTAHLAVLKLFGLFVHLCLVVAVLQARAPVAARLRARRSASGLWAALLNRFAAIWHVIAIFYIVGLWLVWAIEVRNGSQRLIYYCVVSFLVLLAGRLLGVLLLGGFDRMRTVLVQDGHTVVAARAGRYYPVLRWTITGLIWAATGVALLEAWGVPVLWWLAANGLGGRVLDASLTIGLTVLLAIVVWEVANTAIERHLTELSTSAQLSRAGRLRTLLPLLRSALLITIVLVVLLIVLSEIGVNIAPLLAGAGVVGIAVGFGSQKLVQDLITGLFLLLENAMQVGDVVTVAGMTGTVEALTIRTIRLRALDGSVHLIPFSSVSTVTNQTRDYSYAVLDVTIGLDEEPGRIEQVLREIASGMQEDPAWQSIVLDKLDVMGVEQLSDTNWTMRVRIKTQAPSRWAVSRELRRRIKLRFDELAIEAPFTSHKALSEAAASQPSPQPQAA